MLETEHKGGKKIYSGSDVSMCSPMASCFGAVPGRDIPVGSGQGDKATPPSRKQRVSKRLESPDPLRTQFLPLSPTS